MAELLILVISELPLSLIALMTPTVIFGLAMLIRKWDNV